MFRRFTHWWFGCLLLIGVQMPCQAAEHTVLSPELQNLWEQIYNEPEQTLNEVRKRLAASPSKLNHEELAILNAIGAEAASFAEKSQVHLQLAEAAEKIAAPNRYYWPWVHSVSALGIYYEFDGNLALAWEHYQRGVDIAQQSADPQLIAFAYNNLGYYLSRNKGSTETIKAIGQAIHAMENQPKGPLYYDIINNLAMVYTGDDMLNRMDEGRRLLEQSFAYFKARKMRYMMGNGYINLGIFYRQRHELDIAVETFKEAIEFSRRSKIEDLLPYYLMHLGDLYNNIGKYSEALKLGREAQILFRKFGNNKSFGSSILTSSRALLNLKRPNEALAELQERNTITSASNLTKEDELGLEVEIESYHQLNDLRNELKAYRRWGELVKKNYDQKKMESTQQIAGILELERKEAENKLLEEKNSNSTLRLEQADRMSRILMGLLACFALLLGFMLVSLRQSRVIRMQRNRMGEVLNNIEEGILRFGKDFRVEAEFSTWLSKILGTHSDITGQDIFQILLQETNLSADRLDTIRAALGNILEEDELAWSLNNNQLPTELHRQNQILNLLWQPLYNGQKNIDKMLLVIRDVTISKALEAEVQASRQQSQAMTQFLQEMLQANSRSLSRFMEDLDQDLPTHLTLMQDQKEQPLALRKLHTLKGNARSLGLMALAEAAHRLESDQKQQLPISAALEQLQAITMQYKKIFQDIFYVKDHSASSLLTLVDEISPALLKQLDDGCVPFGSLEVRDEIGRWPAKLLGPLRVLLLHGLSNAVDHGYVLAQKTEPAVFGIDAQRIADGIRLNIRDSGGGIRWEKLQRMAEQRGLKPEANRPLTDLLFLDGVSTSEGVTLSSGRGVGLAAVKDACVELGAGVTLLDNDQGPGSMLVVDIPNANTRSLSA